MSKTVVEMLRQCSDEFSFCLTIVDLDDPRRRLIHVNKAYERMTGWSREEAIGRNCKFMQGQGTSRKVVRRIRAKLKNGEACFQDILNYRRDRTPFWNRLLLLPLVTGGGNYYLGIQNDVTHLVRHLTEEERDKISSDFIMHKVNNPLMLILSSYGLLDGAGEVPEAIREKILEEMQNGIRRINDFLIAIDRPRSGEDMDDWFRDGV